MLHLKLSLSQTINNYSGSVRIKHNKSFTNITNAKYQRQHKSYLKSLYAKIVLPFMMTFIKTKTILHLVVD